MVRWIAKRLMVLVGNTWAVVNRKSPDKRTALRE